MTRGQRAALEYALHEMGKIADDLSSAEANAEIRGAAEAKKADPAIAEIVKLSFRTGMLAAACTFRGRELRSWVDSLCERLKITPKGMF